MSAHLIWRMVRREGRPADIVAFEESIIALRRVCSTSG